jgi:isoleucyl-tRNA synthetase
MPHAEADDPRNVLFNTMNGVFDERALGEDDMEKWAKLISLREAVNAALELARADKKIGKSLEAKVTLVRGENADETPQRLFDAFGADIRDLFIVSAAGISDDAALWESGAESGFGGWRIAVSPAPGVKCPRCWKHNEDGLEDGLCRRCADVIG